MITMSPALRAGNEHLLDIEAEALAVDQPRRFDAIAAQGRQESLGLPAAMWSRARPMPSATPSARSSRPSPHRNASTTSRTQDMTKPSVIQPETIWLAQTKDDQARMRFPSAYPAAINSVPTIPYIFHSAIPSERLPAE